MKSTTSLSQSLPLHGTLLLLMAPFVSAAVTPYSWIRLGELGILADSSGTNHPFNAAFSAGGTQGGGGLTATALTGDTAGGPLGTTGTTSTVASIWGSFNTSNNGAWIQGPNNTVPPPATWSLPATNWVMECWMRPIGTGSVRDRDSCQFMSTGTGHFGGRPGGAALRLSLTTDDQGNQVISVRADAIGPNPTDNFTIGTPIVVSTEAWTHVAVVNDNGVTTFYANGVARGESSSAVTAPSGIPYIGSGQDTGASYHGYLDECRYSTFTAGAFTVADLLLVPPGPVFIRKPASADVWEGGAAPFDVLTVADTGTTVQWKRNNVIIAGATGSEYQLASVTPADHNSVFKVTALKGGIESTTPDATLKVIAPQTANNEYYRSAILAEASLQAFFPVDGNTGTSLTNTKDATRPATLVGASYDGRTNRSYGQRALRLNGSGDASIPPAPAYEFADGTGTIEALVYLESQVSSNNNTIFSIATDGATAYYKFRATPDGNTLLYSNDSGASASWAVTPSLAGRLAHVALVFTAGKITAFVDGNSLGTKDHTAFGMVSGLASHIGSSGNAGEGPVDAWKGSIDELAIYGDALSANTLAVHNSRFIFGTAVTAPVIDLAPAVTTPAGTWNIVAGGAPIFRVQASGTAPLTYAWKRNGVAVTGNPSAATPVFTLKSTEALAGTYTCTVSNDVNSATGPSYVVNVAPAPMEKYPAFVLADNPTAYWRLNETVGTAMIDSAGGHNGTYDITKVERGLEAGFGLLPDKAVRFTGAAAVSASVPFSRNLNPTGAFSIEFWAKPDISGQTSRAVLGTQNRNVGRTGYAVYQGFNGNWWEAHLGFNNTVLFLQGTTQPAAGRWDHVVVTWNGSNLSKLFVNGREEDMDASAPHQNNTVQPLEIGSRFNGSVPYQGTVDDVAFYNYDLSAAQVEKHFSVTFVPSSITTQPVAVLNGQEAGSITLTAGVSGFPNTYQWFRNGVALDDTVLNPDLSKKYSSGVTSPTLLIAQGVPADGGQYQLKVTNGLGNSETTPVTVSVALDTTAPVVSYVTASSTFNRVRVGFNKPMLEAGLLLPANYTFTGGLVLKSITLTNTGVTNPAVLDIATTGMAPGGNYTLSISGVKDARISQNVIAANNTAFGPFVLTKGFLTWDYYRGITGTSVDSLKSDTQYPDGVWTNRFLSNFTSMSVTTGGNLNNNPAFGLLGDNYGAHVYGWITPEETASYRFFLRSDDASELWISSNSSSDPANMTQIAFETGCCDPFKDGDESSVAIPMVAGQAYFIEGFYKEGGGGDYLEVAWRKEGDATAPASLTPVPAKFLSTYTPAPVPGILSPPAGGLAGVSSPGVLVGDRATLNWTGFGILQESTNLTTWIDVPGNPESGFTTIVAGAPKKYYRLRY